MSKPIANDSQEPCDHFYGICLSFRVVLAKTSFSTFFDHFSDQFPTILDLIGPILDHIGSSTREASRTWTCTQYIVNSNSDLPTSRIYGYLVSMDQVSMCICRPDIYGCLSTRYLWMSGDQISMSICDFFFARRESSW